MAMAGLTAFEAARIADDAETQAFCDMYAAAPAGLAARLGLRTAEVAGATLLLAPGLPTPIFNRAIGLGLRGLATTDAAEAIEAVFRDAGIKDWWLHWNPLGMPQGMGERLEASGWRRPRRASWAKMLRSPDAPPQFDTPLAIEPVQGDAAREAAAIAVQAFGMPPFMVDWLGALQDGPWRMYGLYDGVQLVGGGVLWVRGDAAWLGIGSVAEGHRGRRGQAALMARRITDAGGAGAIHVVTETGEPTSGGEANPSLANMNRCGFTQVASRLNYFKPAA
ncbi:MAG: hypothetical protein HY854_19875 [Burkholderiales bacterium]|nr:hypothetical protein [Burkholderiales bacterium]